VSLKPWHGVVLNWELPQSVVRGNSKEHIEDGEGKEGKGRREKDLDELLEARGGELRFIFCVGICPSFGNNTLNGSGF
jgi:hypothetical protein